MPDFVLHYLLCALVVRALLSNHLLLKLAQRHQYFLRLRLVTPLRHHLLAVHVILHLPRPPPGLVLLRQPRKQVFFFVEAGLDRAPHFAERLLLLLLLRSLRRLLRFVGDLSLSLRLGLQYLVT